MTYIDDEAPRLLRLREEPDDFEALSTDAMRLIPVDLRLAYPTIHQPDSGCAFQLSPSSATVTLSQESFNAKPSASRDLFNISDFTQQFEVHAGFPALEYQIGTVAKMSRKLDSG